MSAVKLVHLYKKFGNTETLNDINLSLDQGEFLVLLGPSGCGKSTILNIIAGLIDPTEGDVQIHDQSVVGVHPKNRDIAMVFQSYALYPNLSVARNIGFGLEMRGIPKADRQSAVARVAATLKISDLLDRKPSQLSGGQRQRVAIGRALVREPAVFLLDEPLSNLDAKLRGEMRVELKRLHQESGATIVYVTHDQIEAMTLATRIAVIRKGQVEQIDTPKEIYQHPASLFVAGFIGAPPMNFLRGRLQSGSIVLDDGEAGSVSIRLSDGIAPDTRSVVAGIRPEALVFSEEGRKASLKMKVETVELTGPEVLISGSVGQQTLMTTANPDTQVRVGEQVTLYFDPSSLCLFDPESGKRLV